jgi:hypothetical protein
MRIGLEVHETPYIEEWFLNSLWKFANLESNSRTKIIFVLEHSHQNTKHYFKVLCVQLGVVITCC